MTACVLWLSEGCQLDWNATGSMFGAFGSILSALVAIIGLWYIYGQLKLSREANQAQAKSAKEQALAATMQAKSRLLDLSNPINNLIFQNPDVYNFTYIGDENSIPPKYTTEWKRLMALCEMQANYIEFVIPSMKLLEEDEQKAWDSFIRDTMNRPMFREFWDLRSPWYDPEMHTFIASSRKEQRAGSRSDQSPRP